MKKSDYEMVTLYTIHVTKDDHTGHFIHFLDETEASQELWKEFKNKLEEIRICKTRYLFSELPEDIQKKIQDKKPIGETPIAL